LYQVGISRQREANNNIRRAI